MEMLTSVPCVFGAHKFKMLRTAFAKSCYASGPLRALSTSSCSRAGEGLKGFSENEKTIEDLYFNKDDQRLLAKILSKVKVQSDVADAHGAAGVRAAEQSALKAIVDKYKMSAEDLKKLETWKHTQF